MLPDWMKKHFNVPEGSAEEKALLDWQHELRGALEKRDASKLALKLVYEGVPPELRQYLYGLILKAPWRDPRRGVKRSLNKVQEIALVNLYTLLAAGVAVDGIRLDREGIILHLSSVFRVSRTAVERCLQSRKGALPKTPRIVRANFSG